MRHDENLLCMKDIVITNYAIILLVYIQVCDSNHRL